MGFRNDPSPGPLPFLAFALFGVMMAVPWLWASCVSADAAAGALQSDKAHAAEVAGLNSRISKLEARVGELESKVALIESSPPKDDHAIVCPDGTHTLRFPDGHFDVGCIGAAPPPPEKKL